MAVDDAKAVEALRDVENTDYLPEPSGMWRTRTTSPTVVASGISRVTLSPAAPAGR